MLDIVINTPPSLGVSFDVEGTPDVQARFDDRGDCYVDVTTGGRTVTKQVEGVVAESAVDKRIAEACIETANEWIGTDFNAMEKVVIPEGVTNIRPYFLNETRVVKTIVLPETLKSISANAFCNCRVLTQINLPAGVTSLEENIFRDCNKLNCIHSVPKGVTKCNQLIFCGTAIDYFVFHENVESIDWLFFSTTAKWIWLQGSTPPTLPNATPFRVDANTKIYVPDAAVDTYKAATNWVNFADYIYPESEMPEEYKDGI